MSLPRRRFLWTAGLTAIGTSVVFRGSASVASSTAVMHYGRPMQLATSGFAGLQSWVCPGPVSISGVSSGVIEFMWDSRLATGSSPTVLVARGDGRVQRLEGKLGSSEGRGLLRIPLVGLGRTDLARAWIHPQIDPRIEALRRDFAELVPTQVRLIDAVGPQLIQPAAPDRSLLAGDVWAGELSVLWEDANRSRVAALATHAGFLEVTSAGPAAIPAGTRIVVSADAATVGVLELDGLVGTDGNAVSMSTSSEKAGLTQRLELTLIEPIAAGETIRLVLSSTKAAGRRMGEEERARTAVAIEPGRGSRSVQRSTGRESWTMAG